MNSSTGNGFVKVTDPDGNQAVYYYDQDPLAAQSEWTDYALLAAGLTFTSENDSVPDTTAASASNLGGGTLLGTSGTDADGYTTTGALDADL